MRAETDSKRERKRRRLFGLHSIPLCTVGLAMHAEQLESLCNWVTSVSIATCYIPSDHPVKSTVMCELCYQKKHYYYFIFNCVCVCLLFVRVHCRFQGGHDNFRKMIDEAEPLGYPVVVKNARGHRGKLVSPYSLFCLLNHSLKSSHNWPLMRVQSTLIWNSLSEC